MHPRKMSVERFQRLRMLRGKLHARALRSAHDHRNVHLTAGEVPHLRSMIDDLVGGDDREVDGHHLDDRPQPQHGHSDRSPDHPRLGDRRVDDPLRTVLLQHAGSDAERAFVDPDVLAHDEDIRVAIHLFHHRFAYRVAVTFLTHSVSLSRTGRGPCSATTSVNSSSASGCGLSSANLTAFAAMAVARSSIAFTSSSLRPHTSDKRLRRMVIGSRWRCRSTSSFARYGCSTSAAPCPLKRYVTASMQYGLPVSRTRATTRSATPRTAKMSCPSTFSVGMSYACTRAERSVS